MAQTHFSGPIAVGAASVEDVTVAKTLTNRDSGKTFLLKGATTGATITLPEHKDGLWFKFIVGAAFATTDWIIDHDASLDDTMEGALMIVSTVLTVDAAKALNFDAGSENVGDWLTVESIGSIWYVDGRSLNSTGITVTA